MQPRAFLRVIGRIFIVSLIAVLATDTYINREPTHLLYMQKYDAVRNLLYFKRVLNLPPARFVEGLLDYLYWIDFYYLIVMGFMILLVTPIGGWMMLLYFFLKLTIWYSPYLFYAPKMSFTSRDAMNIFKIFTCLGIALGLTGSPQKDKVKLQKQNSQEDNNEKRKNQ